MLEEARKFNESMREFFDLLIKDQFNLMTMEGVSEDTIKGYATSIEILNRTFDYIEKQAEIMDQQNEKLDELLKLVKK